MDISKKRSLTITHWNCNSINNKIEEFKIFLLKYKPDIISLNETKVNEINANFLFNNIEDYNFIHKHRKNNRNGGGGVALLINKKIKFVELNMFDHLNLELACIKIKIKKKETLIISYYNPPTSILSKEVFRLATDSKINFIICGDLNSKSTSLGCYTNNNNGIILNEIITENDCIIANNSTHTYFSFRENNIHTQSDILDLFICSSRLYSEIKEFSVLTNEDMTSDHVPINLTLSEKLVNAAIKPKLVYNYNKANWSLFRQSLPSNAPRDILDNVELLSSFIVDNLLKAAECAIPKKDINNSRKCLPKYILDMIKVRKVYRKKYQKERLIEFRAKYNSITKVIRNEIDAYKNIEWSQFVKKQGSNPLNSKPFWQKLNSIRKKQSVKSLPSLNYENKIYESSCDKANLFANILKTTFADNDDSKFDAQFKNQTESKFKSAFKLLNKKNPSNVFSWDEFKNTIKRLKNHSAPGRDNIHNLLIKNSPDSFKKVILHLVNVTVEKNSIPLSWKESQITLIPKKKANSDNPKDYRPISLTSNLAKLAEKLLAIKLKEFMKKNNIIIKQQSGFRHQRQTRDNILFITQKISEQFNRQKKVCAIFFDIASAFDKVWHIGLFYKMLKLKFPSYIIFGY